MAAYCYICVLVLLDMCPSTGVYMCLILSGQDALLLFFLLGDVTATAGGAVSGCVYRCKYVCISQFPRVRCTAYSWYTAVFAHLLYCFSFTKVLGQLPFGGNEDGIRGRIL
jgi:hypothetical protein